MITLTTVQELKAWVRAMQARGSRIGLVPTMGALHEGHLSLVDAARAGSDAVVMSIFVNPTQFGPNEDLSRYPARPRARQRAGGVARRRRDLRPRRWRRCIPRVPRCGWYRARSRPAGKGEFRPGHFAGVLTIVAKLFHLAEPDCAWFGQKDFQQATLIRQMVRDLDFPLEVVVVPDGAGGGRTGAEQPERVPVSRRPGAGAGTEPSARGGGGCIRQRHARRGRAGTLMRGGLAVHPGVKVEYIAVADPRTLEPVQQADETTVVLMAARVGSTRLIDNVILSKGL